MPDHLQKIAALAAKAKNIAAESITLENFLNTQSKAGKAAPLMCCSA
jgi:hypothetical protein